MGARAGRKGVKGFNIKTCGNSVWRKYLDKRKRKTAKKNALADQEMWLQAGAEAYWRVEQELEKEDE